MDKSAMVGTGKLSGQGFDLSGRVAVVTASGANGGIGHACALALARAGADVVTNSRGAEHCEQTASEVRALGRRGLGVAGDMSRPGEVRALFAALDAEFGRIDILVNNAGTGSHQHPEEVGLEEWNAIVSLNLTGTFLCCQEAARRMIARGSGGSIVNVSSIAGALALGRGNFVYSVTKGGINQMTRELAVEWAHHGIRVNAVLPAQILTPRLQQLIDDPTFSSGALVKEFLHGIPMGRFGLPDEIAGPVLFLASDAAAFVTGVLLPADGGNLALNAGGSHTWPK
jgi:NAD(P)-dependent dehydrogenase (short-subunit alcohol dehydrogenase family)